MAPRLLRAALLAGALTACGGGVEEPSAAESPGARSGDAPSSADSMRLGGLTYELRRCALRIQPAAGPAKTVDTGLTGGDCRFVRSDSGEPQRLGTPDGTVVLVYTSKRNPDGVDCDTRIRALLLSGEQVTVSSAEQRIMACLDGPVDPMMIEVFHAGLREQLRTPSR